MHHDTLPELDPETCYLLYSSHAYELPTTDNHGDFR